MPALKNQKHEAFAQAIALGAAAAKAYRDGWDCSNDSAETAGPRLAKNVEVKFRIDELRGKVSEKVDQMFGLTRDKWLARLHSLSLKAEEAEDYSASIKAADTLGKASGWFEPEQHQMEVNITIGGDSNG